MSPSEAHVTLWERADASRPQARGARALQSWPVGRTWARVCFFIAGGVGHATTVFPGAGCGVAHCHNRANGRRRDPPLAPPAEQRDPEAVFRKACDRLVAMEAKNDLLKGVSEIKPVTEQDDKKRLKSAQFVFERNATPPGKGPAKPKDEGKPFVYVSVQVWAGRSQQPPADLHEFEWKGQTYQMWVRVFGSDAELVKVVRKAVDEPLSEPSTPKP